MEDLILMGKDLICEITEYMDKFRDPKQCNLEYIHTYIFTKDGKPVIGTYNDEEDKLIKKAISKILIRYSTFFNEPASTKFHGAYKGGLIDHSLAVYLAAIRTSIHYGIQASEVNPIACLFHDICKVGKYKLIKDNKSDDGFKYVYNNEYNGIEHGAESLRRLLNIEGVGELISEPWQIAIAYHMGVFGVSSTEMQNFSTMSERYPEVLLLHHADMIATKIYDL